MSVYEVVPVNLGSLRAIRKLDPTIIYTGHDPDSQKEVHR